MNRLFILKTKHSRKEEGFTTLEVLISLFIALAFVAVSMQSLVYAMAMRVQAQEKQRANELIQEDIESFNQLGSDANLAGTCNATAYAGSYAEELWNARNFVLATPPTKTIIKKIKSDGSVETGGKQLALRAFEISSTANNSTAPHRTLKVGYQVWDWDGANYTNQNGGALTAGDEPIAETYVEIIPDVALQCP